TVTVDDGHGSTTTQDVTVTITGTNDAVSITSGAQAGAVVEDADATPSTTDSLSATGTISFSDVDLSDTHSASFTAAAGNTTALGTFSLDPVSEAANAATGSVGWTYSLNNAASQYLADGQSVTETYTVTVNDGHGGHVDQTVTVTITGTNDGPTIVAAATDTTGAVTEDLAVNGSGNLTATGTITFNDVDLIDVHSTTVVAAAGNTLGGTLTMGAVSESASTAAGTAGWTYSVADSATQYLAAGETTTETFTVTIADGQGGHVDQTVTVTITGANDGPTIVAAATDTTGAVTEDLAVNGSGNLTATGTITFNDVDLIDVHSTTVVAAAGNTLGGTLTMGAVSESASTAAGTAGWTYSVADSATQYLAAG